MDYAEYPVSINQLRCARSGNAADWTPRDILIHLLREIDSGRLNPESLVTVFREKREGGYMTDYCSACPDSQVMLGLLETGKQLLWRSR